MQATNHDQRNFVSLGNFQNLFSVRPAAEGCIEDRSLPREDLFCPQLGHPSISSLRGCLTVDSGFEWDYVSAELSAISLRTPSELITGIPNRSANSPAA